MSSTLLRNVTIADDTGTDHPASDAGSAADATDVLVVDGVIAAIGTHAGPGPTAVDTTVVDLEGWLLMTSAVEPHAHLDKAFLAERIVNPTGDLMGAITAMRSHAPLVDVADIVERAERAAHLLAANGYRAVRTHADTTVDNGLRSIEALVEVRRRVAAIIDIEIVALCGWPLVGREGARQRALLDEALEAGADLVGGCPHLEGNGNATAATELLLQAASDHAVGVDLHTDETLDPSVLALDDLAEMVLAGFAHPVTASHCVSLGMQTPARQHEIAERVAAAGINVVALPHTNLFLQGRGHSPMPRGLTAVAALRSAGVNVAAGADNLQDPFNPVGRACPFETAGLMIMTSHLLPHEAWHAVTQAPRMALGLPPTRIAVGEPADLIAVEAATLREAIAFGPTPRRVWRGDGQPGNAELTDATENASRRAI